MILNKKKKENYLRLSTNKSQLSELLGLNRKCIYYKLKRPNKDTICKLAIESVHLDNPAYGHRRIGLALGYNHKKASRLMHKYNIKPPRRRTKHWYTTVSIARCHYTNLIKGLTNTKSAQVYCTDLTYLKYQGKQFYLATVEDIYTREIMAADISDKHDSDLALSVAKKSITRQKPQIFHSDQGTEFMAEKVTGYLTGQNISISVSDKGSPWQNGYKESFYGRFKEENGDLNRFETLGELVEEIFSYIHYYNTYRIHTNLKMSPLQFKQKLLDSVS